MYTVGGDTQKGSAATENIMEIPQKLRIDLPCGPAIPVMGICPMEIKIGYQKYVLPYLSLHYHKAKVWKQAKCPSTDDSMMKTR